MKSARPFERARRHNLAYLFGTEQVFVCYDLETTGLDIPNVRMVQICAKKCRARKDGTVDVFEEMTEYVYPSIPISEGAAKKTGITMDTVKDAPTEDVLFPRISEFFGNLPVCGYNIDHYDNIIMADMYARYGRAFRPAASIDVLESARDIVPAGPEKRSLSSIAELYGVAGGSRAHDAAGDVDMCVRVLQCIRAEYEAKQLPSERKKLYCNYTWFADGHNRAQKGIYIATQFYRKKDKKKVNLWYSVADKCYYSAQLDPAEYDVDDLTAQLMKQLGCSYSELQKMSRKSYDALREGRRP